MAIKSQLLKIICFQEQLEQPLQKYYKVVKVGTYILRGYLSVNMITTFLEVYAVGCTNIVYYLYNNYVSMREVWVQYKFEIDFLLQIIEP